MRTAARLARRPAPGLVPAAPCRRVVAHRRPFSRPLPPLLALLAALAVAAGPVAAQEPAARSVVRVAGERGGVGTGAEAGARADTLTLEAALGRALVGSPLVSSDRASVAAERAARWADWGAFLPTANASQSFSRTSFTRTTFIGDDGIVEERPEPFSDVSKSSGRNLNLQWNVVEGGGRFFDLRSGAAARRAAGLRLRETERTVAAEVKVAYYEALKQQRLVEIGERQLENRRQDLERTRERFRLAVADRRDVLGAEFEVRQEELALLDARDEASSRRRELRVAMGEDPDGAGGAALAEPPPAPEARALTVAAAVERALEANPELRSLRADVARAEADRVGAWTRYLPTVTLTYSESRSANAGAPGDFFQLDLPNTRDNVGFSASWNVFEGFGRREETARARADERRTRAELRRRQLEIERAVRDRVDEVKRRAARVDLLEEQFAAARERLELSREGYRAGTVSFDELQRAIDELTSSERNLVRERFDYLVAWARLEEEAGRGVGGRGAPSPDAGVR